MQFVRGGRTRRDASEIEQSPRERLSHRRGAIDVEANAPIVVPIIVEADASNYRHVNGLRSVATDHRDRFNHLGMRSIISLPPRSLDLGSFVFTD